MNAFEVILVLAFFVVLIIAICFVVSFYVCDGYNCKAFTCAESQAPRGTKEYAIALLGEMFNDGIWPLPYIAAAIITPFALYFLCVPMTVRAFAIVFLVCWLFAYFAFSFIGHHYVRFITLYVSEYITNSCPGGTFTRDIPSYDDPEPPSSPNTNPKIIQEEPSPDDEPNNISPDDSSPDTSRVCINTSLDDGDINVRVADDDSS